MLSYLGKKVYKYYQGNKYIMRTIKKPNDKMVKISSGNIHPQHKWTEFTNTKAQNGQKMITWQYFLWVIHINYREKWRIDETETGIPSQLKYLNGRKCYIYIR